MTVVRGLDGYHELNQLQFRWAGWTANAYDLHRAGWEFSLSHHPWMMSTRVAIRQRQGGVCGYSEFDERMLRYEEDSYGRVSSFPVGVTLDFRMARDIQFRILEKLPPFVPVVPRGANEVLDANAATEIVSMQGRAGLFFRPLPPQTEDVQITPPTFDEILDMALASQEERQAEIRKKMIDQKRRETSGLIITCAA